MQTKQSMHSKQTKQEKQILLGYHIIITLIFVYIFIQFLSLKRTNIIFKIYADYILNKYCLILYMLLSLLIMKYDAYTGILLLVLVIAPFKIAIKEYFNNETFIDNTIIDNTIIDNTNASIPIPNIGNIEGRNIKTINNKSTLQVSQVSQASQELINTNTPSTTQPIDIIRASSGPNYSFSFSDNRFKTDAIAINEILRQIKAQIDFDAHKTELSKHVIYEIYNKYFDNDIFVKLKTNLDDSKDYNADGKLSYIPEPDKITYDLSSYNNLSNNSQIGINSNIDSK